MCSVARNWRTTPCRLTAAAFSIHSQLPSIPEARSYIRNPRTRHAAAFVRSLLRNYFLLLRSKSNQLSVQSEDSVLCSTEFANGPYDDQCESNGQAHTPSLDSLFSCCPIDTWVCLSVCRRFSGFPTCLRCTHSHLHHTSR